MAAYLKRTLGQIVVFSVRGKTQAKAYGGTHSHNNYCLYRFINNTLCATCTTSKHAKLCRIQVIVSMDSSRPGPEAPGYSHAP